MHTLIRFYAQAFLLGGEGIISLMHKLVILFHGPTDPTLDPRWPQFLHQAEAMPGLRREAHCRVEQMLYGSQPVRLLHELYFDTLADLQAGMASAAGVGAGQLLQAISAGQFSLLVAEHRQDEAQNLHPPKK
ncbi:MAG: hypothetical protein R6V73_01715 [Anaerolineales bacterium]